MRLFSLPAKDAGLSPVKAYTEQFSSKSYRSRKYLEILPTKVFVATGEPSFSFRFGAQAYKRRWKWWWNQSKTNVAPTVLLNQILNENEQVQAKVY